MLALADSASSQRMVFVNPTDCAAYCVSVTRVRAAIRDGALPCILGSRQRKMVPEADLVRWRDSRRVACEDQRTKAANDAD
ncbi:MAG TPA: hypothetical protein VIV60_12700, partial [Polyangiaceae bacterium]